MSKTGITTVRHEPSTPLPEGKTDWERVTAMTDAEVMAAALSDPDAQPLTEEQLTQMRRPVDIKALRERLGLTQETFAATYQIPVGTLRDWEQRRKAPDAPARAYLRVIQADPEAVAAALKPTSLAAA